MGETPLTTPLSHATDHAEAGGKARSLAALLRHGFPVPDGFVVTTSAYRRRGDPETAAAIAQAARGLTGPVAVRSSATAEDLPGLSFAGQHDTVLGVEGPEAILAAVRKCWDSLDSERARAYRERTGIAHAEMAVVVQRLVPAEAAGVLFTVDPVTGVEAMVINAGWGLGETVVDGTVTPDTYVLGPQARREVGDKAVRTVLTATGTAVQPVPEAMRREQVLDEGQIQRLAALGDRAHRVFGPSDVEWVWDGSEFAVVQVRPVTGQAAEAREWNDTVRGDYLWTCVNLGEAVPSVMTPATWSAVSALAPPPLAGHRMTGIVGGRFYLNVSAAIAVGRALGLGALVRKGMRQTMGELPDDIPRLPLSRFEAVKGALRVARKMLGAATRYRRTISRLVAGNARRCADLREAITSAATPAALAALWRSDLHDLLHTDCRTFDTGARQGGPGRLHARVRALVGERDAATLVTGLHDDSARLDSLGPVLGLARVRRGELDRAEYARVWGHRCADEFELSAPRPAEDPAWLDRELAHADGDPDELLRAQRQARERAWARHPHLRAKLRAPLARAAAAARERERARSEVVRCFAVLRAFWLRAGELTGHGDDVFFLPEAELLRVLDGDQGPVAAVPGRRVAYERYRALPPYPPVIRGRFDPVSWAAGRGAPAGGAAGITGFPGAAGVVEGAVRVLSTVEEGVALQAGEVLVTTVTNIGWTPLFPRAAAVVTDIGAPLSHAAIVARELGVPAVVGCGDAVARLRTGTRVRVDGAAGTVTVLG